MGLDEGAVSLRHKPPLSGMGRQGKRERTVQREIPTEFAEQCAVIRFWDYYAPTQGIDPRLLFAVANGAYLGKDPRQREITMALLKKSGLRPGALDLVCAVTRLPKWPGLFLEMKRINGTLSIDQQEFRALLMAQGYRVEVCYGADQAIDRIRAYVEG